MMTGEIDFEDTFNHEEEDAEGSGNGTGGAAGKGDSSLLTYRVVHLVFFLAFLISVPVGFYNLLTGFALDKVMELRERAKVGQLAKQVEHIFYIESLLLGLRPVGKVLSHDQMTYWLRKMNVTTIKLDNEQKFQTVFREKLRKAGGHLRNDWSLWDCLCGVEKWNTTNCCQRRLSSEVIEQIYALASSITEKQNNEALLAEQSQASK
ncbi:Transient receptor potential channel pyrexia [Orchesella cincta]|uniref:Transient receptor potential channel pyrexia n=1 Tax=Orchesella cincta TaxID=48709 RepID=A0A1D2MTP2_ORCCI|nr:Transient receptor potential channel pyrexia [Orchesella cincta]